MSSIPPDQFRRLFEYEQDAHERILDSLRRTESDHHDDANRRYSGPDTIAHIMRRSMRGSGESCVDSAGHLHYRTPTPGDISVACATDVTCSLSHASLAP